MLKPVKISFTSNWKSFDWDSFLCYNKKYLIFKKMKLVVDSFWGECMLEPYRIIMKVAILIKWMIPFSNFHLVRIHFKNFFISISHPQSFCRLLVIVPWGSVVVKEVQFYPWRLYILLILRAHTFKGISLKYIKCSFWCYWLPITWKTSWF